MANGPAQLLMCANMEETCCVSNPVHGTASCLWVYRYSSGCPSLSIHVALYRRSTPSRIDSHSFDYSSYSQRNASSFRDRLVLVYGAVRRRHDLFHGGLGKWLLLGGFADLLMGGHGTSGAWRRLM